MEDKRNNIVEEKEIDLLVLANKLWVKKKFILKVLAIGLVIGLIVAFSIPKEYTTTVILTPESQSATSGNMGSLAALAGVNLGSAIGEDALASPELYPSVISSTPFLRGLLDIKVIDSKKNIDTTLYSYMRDYQSAAWWGYILKAPGLLKGLFTSDDKKVNDENNPDSRFIPEEEQNILNGLANRLTISSEKKTGITTISVTMQSPKISAYIADTVTSYLQSYIIDYRTQKARKDLAYAEKLYEESKDDYYEKQSNLAAYVDGNMNVVSAKYRTIQERLQNEANLAYTVYNQMAQQLQMAKVKVQDTTPVFTVIQPAVEPLLPSKPSKKMIIVGFIFLSIIVSSFWILKKDLWAIVSNSNE
ncbi:chain-length determining protein [Dysgonomonas sp. Marseille-P4677]|uniref:Wzz/FepE/Etk N-terminal domain-containing protein n=1 Tax=Dysgonomonas sp. Marseille-P4677 TaxID=2364790 RepID=UPI0019146D92|nr:Wzz/FepE/Etk N-terminal domain-containing protein [Dysgonomonas sp. Marseille-P4677]MBK5719459.1 chain-length determining protein [Dysgonomonas sp. Marseille-P4677]